MCIIVNTYYFIVNVFNIDIKCDYDRMQSNKFLTLKNDTLFCSMSADCMAGSYFTKIP